MDRLLPTVVILTLIVAVIALMFVGWRSRRRRQAGIGAPLEVPMQLARASGLLVDGWYVATTPAHEPLERIAVHGLGFRARASIAVHSEGLVLERRGSAPLYVPAVDLRSVERATWAIDRVVEPDGLVVFSWMLGTTPVDTYLRISERDAAEQLLAAIHDLLPAPDTAEEVAT